MTDRLQLGMSARYRLYQTAEGWICLAAVEGVHLEALGRCVGATLETDDVLLARQLEGIFATRSASEWFAVLDSHEVPVEISSQTFSRDTTKPGLAFSLTPALVAGPAPKSESIPPKSCTNSVSATKRSPTSPMPPRCDADPAHWDRPGPLAGC